MIGIIFVLIVEAFLAVAAFSIVILVLFALINWIVNIHHKKHGMEKFNIFED